MKVTCIMPTAGRPELVPLAVQCFLDQTYEDRELVIYNDGDGEDYLIRGNRDPRIRYFRRRQGIEKPIGALRNICCDLAQGELIAHWDDDDYSSPFRLSEQVSLLKCAREFTGAHVSITGYSDLAFYDERTREGWLYSANSAHYAPGTTFLYRKAFWHSNPFQDIDDVSEDNHFIDSHPVATQPSYFPADPVTGRPASFTMIARAHLKMTAPKKYAGQNWRPLENATEVQLMKELLR